MPERPIEPVLDPGCLESLRRGVEEFNSGRFFECHDTLEEVWQGMRGPARDFFQGLIQVAVGFYHLRNGNLHGGESQLGRALNKLSGYGEEFLGLQVAVLRTELLLWLEALRSRPSLPDPLPSVPRLQWGSE
jgi:predicted metal-dependent hydrolase